MIPRKIHYCWFGRGEKPRLAQKCIASWKKYCPDYKIIEWNEQNFDISKNRYVQQAYEAKKYAFVSDYARLAVVYEYGGIYLDTDVELVRPLDELLELPGFMGFQTNNEVATGLGFGARKGNPVVQALLRDYDALDFLKADGSADLTPCPERNTRVLQALGVTDAFDMAEADFTPLTDNGAWLSSAMQAARVKIDEEGVEAAAYTELACADSAMMEVPPTVEMDLDRPFLFVIFDYNDIPLFVGTVNALN